MPPLKTYILPPTFDYPPTSSIRLGNLLADPFTPHRPLAVLPDEKRPHITTSTQTNLSVTRSKGHGSSLSLSAQILVLAGVKIASEISHSGSTTYSATTVTTRFFEADPDEETIRNLVVTTPRANRLLFGNAVVGKLFMITGIRTAEGFTVSNEKDVKRGGSLGGDMPLAAVVPGIEVGAEVGGYTERGEAEGYQVEGEVVIAYRVVVIKKRGWKGRELDLREYRASDRERMLGDDDDIDDAAAGVEVGEMTVDDITTEHDSEELDVSNVVLDTEDGEAVVLSMGHDIS